MSAGKIDRAVLDAMLAGRTIAAPEPSRREVFIANVLDAFAADVRDEGLGTISRADLVSATADRLEILAGLGYGAGYAELVRRAQAAGVEVSA